MKKQKDFNNSLISLKVNRILNGILVLIFLIIIRVWYLSIFQHEEKVRASEKPQKRVTVLKSDRATIRDRFDIPLAMNKVQYNATLCYGEIREIPRTAWAFNEKRKKVKYFKRKDYITKLAELIGSELQLDPLRMEDLIHAKASLLGKIPFIIKENISEAQYFRLKMLEKDFPGLHGEQVAKRYYPLGPTVAEVIGYMGPISRSEYDLITAEMRELQSFLMKWEQEEGDFLPLGYSSIEEVKERLKEIEKKAYTINDNVGKSGIEKAFDEKLRGFSGKKSFASDIKGNYLRELPGSIEPKAGNRLYLTISKELQEYAESLLAEYDQSAMVYLPAKGIWMKGGAIVVMDPNTGDILTLASYPRFNPNDFIRCKDGEENQRKNIQVQKWLETESYVAALWDGKEALTRERFDVGSGTFFEEYTDINWETYLSMILPKEAPVKKALEKIKTIKDAVYLQNKVEELLAIFEFAAPSKIFDTLYSKEGSAFGSGVFTLQEKDFLQSKYTEKKEEIEKIKKELHPFFHHLTLNYDKILLTDLCRLAVNGASFTPQVLEIMGKESLHSYRELSSKIVSIQEALKGIVKDTFHEVSFKKWKEENFKAYLALKRKEEEKEKKKYARPFIDYQDEAENALFVAFWEKNRYDFLTLFLCGVSPSDTLEKEYIEPLVTWRNELLQGAYSGYAWAKNFLQVRGIVEEFSPTFLSSYLQTLRSYNELNRPLLGKYISIRDSKGIQLEKHLAAAFYPKFGFGYLRSYTFRQSAIIGSIFKLIPAYEALKQRLDQGKNVSDLNPLTIIDDKHCVSGKGEWNVGYTLDKRPIPLIYRGGRLPRTEHAGVGRVDLVRALEVSSNPYFALIAGDVLEDPEDLRKAAALFSYGKKTEIDLPGETPGFIPSDIIYNRSGLYAMSIGQHALSGTPLQTAVMLSAIGNHGKVLKPKILLGEIEDGQFHKNPPIIRWHVYLPAAIRSILLKGMKQVIHGDSGTARGIKDDFSESLLRHIVGKTSTAEVIEKVSLDGKEGMIKCKHIWFGAISFDPKTKEEYAKPELVVVVYLRFGEWGRMAAPLAVKMIQKFQEIRDRELVQSPTSP